MALHDRYGDATYWKARRSMRFNKDLREIANDFRKKFLNSTDEQDRIVLPDDWRLEKVILIKLRYVTKINFFFCPVIKLLFWVNWCVLMFFH